MIIRNTTFFNIQMVIRANKNININIINKKSHFFVIIIIIIIIWLKK